MSLAGNANDIRGAYPKGDDSVVLVVLTFDAAVNSQTQVAKIFVPFKCEVKGVYVATGALTSDPTLEIVTGEASAQTIVTAANIPAGAATDPTAMTVADSGPVPAGTSLVVTIACDSGDAIATGSTVTLLLRPSF